MVRFSLALLFAFGALAVAGRQRRCARRRLGRRRAVQVHCLRRLPRAERQQRESRVAEPGRAARAVRPQAAAGVQGRRPQEPADDADGDGPVGRRHGGPRRVLRRAEADGPRSRLRQAAAGPALSIAAAIRRPASPACAACHGPTGDGNPPASYPALRGQHATYVAAQLRAYRAGTRQTDPNQMMRNVASTMSDEQIDAVASYVQGLR